MSGTLASLPDLPPGLPRAGDEPVFREPWEAQAFAMAVALHQRGLFTWTEWADQLARTIAAARERGEPDLGDTYYTHWLAALEALVSARVTDAVDALARSRNAWTHACERTPHGQPIVLEARDYEAR